MLPRSLRAAQLMDGMLPMCVSLQMLGQVGPPWLVSQSIGLPVVLDGPQTVKPVEPRVGEVQMGAGKMPVSICQLMPIRRSSFVLLLDLMAANQPLMMPHLPDFMWIILLYQQPAKPSFLMTPATSQV